MSSALIISFYDRRPLEPLVSLLDSLDRHAAGSEVRRLLVVNATGAQEIPTAVASRVDEVFTRANRGMNIGAWDAGWRHWPGFDNYLFLQDECFAVRDGWMRAVEDALAKPGAGLVGESLNPAWDKDWDALRTTAGTSRLPEHLIDGRAADNRVDCYLHHMRRYGIEPGSGGRHLRSLVWALSADTLRAIGGFPEGGNYGECIAAEIGVSRAVAALDRRVEQFADAPFHFFRHCEWNQDRAGGPFTHKPVTLREIERLRENITALEQRWQQPRWRDVGTLLHRRVRSMLAGGSR